MGREVGMAQEACWPAATNVDTIMEERESLLGKVFGKQQFAMDRLRLASSGVWSTYASFPILKFFPIRMARARFASEVRHSRKKWVIGCAYTPCRHGACDECRGVLLLEITVDQTRCQYQGFGAAI